VWNNGMMKRAAIRGAVIAGLAVAGVCAAICGAGLF